MRSCPRVGSFEKTIVRLVATRRSGWLSDGSRRSRNGVVPVAPLSSRATTTSVVIVSPALLRQPKYATYTVLFCATAGRIDGPFWPSVLRDSIGRDVNVAPPFKEMSTVAVRPFGAAKSLMPTYSRSVLAVRMARTKGWSTLGRVASCVIAVAERTSFVSRSLSAMLGVLKIVAYSVGGARGAWVMSAVCTLLGRVLRSDQVLPPSSET